MEPPRDRASPVRRKFLPAQPDRGTQRQAMPDKGEALALTTADIAQEFCLRCRLDTVEELKIVFPKTNASAVANCRQSVSRPRNEVARGWLGGPTVQADRALRRVSIAPCNSQGIQPSVCTYRHFRLHLNPSFSVAAAQSIAQRLLQATRSNDACPRGARPLAGPYKDTTHARDRFIAVRRANGMKHPPRYCLPLALAIALGVLARPCASAEAVPAQRLDGFNVIAAAGHPFGSASAKVALANAKRLGAGAVAIIPFLWQPHPASPNIRRGDDMADIELRIAIRDAHALGLAAIVKPQVWVPESWAGAIAMDSQSAWQDWFAHYRRALDPIARIAEEEKAEGVVIGPAPVQLT